MSADILEFPPTVPRFLRPHVDVPEPCQIRRWPRHKLAHCGRPDCHCGVCSGLALCEVCGGAEGSLPTDCPGERMTDAVEDMVQAGVIDYRRRGGWIRCVPITVAACRTIFDEDDKEG